MTYLKTSNIWGKLFAPFARCQSKSISQQLDSNIRFFDLCVYYEDGEWIFKHGLVKYTNIVTLMDVLDTIESRSSYKYYDYSIVRLTLECSKSNPKMETEFIDLCKWIDKFHASSSRITEYAHISFIGGCTKHLWRQLYTFKHQIYKCNLHEWYRSAYGFHLSIYPKYWSHQYNDLALKNWENIKDSIAATEDHDHILMLDFV